MNIRKTKNLHRIVISAFMGLLSWGFSFAATDVTITVSNIPAEFENEEIAMVGFFNDWNNSGTTSVVSGNTLTFVLSDINLTPLDDGWLHTPEGANFAFGFFEPGTWNQKIVGNYGSNDNNFRLSLKEDISNEVLIDGQYNVATSPVLIIDPIKGITVNGEVQVPDGSTAGLQVNIVNLPAGLEGMELAIVGSVNAWNNNYNLATVSDNALIYTLENVPVQDLGAAWTFAPEGANAAFSFVVPGSWEQKIHGNFYGLNDNHFRVSLVPDTDNIVKIDAQHRVAESPAVIIDQNTGLTVNGSNQLPPPIRANAKFTVVNLPAEFNGRSIALTASFLEGESELPESIVSDNSLSFSIEDLELEYMDDSWTDAPLDANISFAFVHPETLEKEIIGDYANNGGLFRIRLAAKMDNQVVINASESLASGPLTIDKEKGIYVNKNIQVPNRSIDPTKFAWPEGKWKALIMSYDDGPAADTQMVRLFNDNGIKGTFNLSSSFLNRTDFLASSQVADLFDDHEVANHSVNHPYLAQLDTTGIKNELRNCRDLLSSLTGYDIKGLAYPFGGVGTYDYRVIDIAKNLGIRYARTTNDSYSLEIPSDLPDGLMQWSPTVNDWDAAKFSEQLLNWEDERMALLYIWGHSHFLDEAGWLRLNTFCETMANLEDTWYATNLEVADYLLAISELVFDGDEVYNPSTDIKVWMKTESGFLELEPMGTAVEPVFPKTTMMSELQVAPNPVTGEARITYYLPSDDKVDIALYDLHGRRLATLLNHSVLAGEQELTMHTSDLENGIYFIILRSDELKIRSTFVVLH